jgi:energy-coupling factor transporter ATP-binding protein EcfA2
MSEAASVTPQDERRVLPSDLASTPVSEQECPFVGLRAFEKEQAHLFFGRERQIDDLLSCLNESRFLAVLGASGSGKSSLVRAGLLQALDNGFLNGVGSEWKALVMRPGSAPFNALALALLERREAPGAKRDATLSELEASLTQSTRGLVETVRTRFKGNVLLIVDQFEELFRLGRHTKNKAAWLADRRAFVESLLEACREPELRFYVAVTMRTDFLGECAEFRGLPEAMNAGQYLVPSLRAEELALAVSEPMETSNQHITTSLVTRVVSDAEEWFASDRRRSADALPIMQHALMRAWLAWRSAGKSSEPMGISDYERAQGKTNALDTHAEEIYSGINGSKDKPGFSQAEQAACEILFRRLSCLSWDGRITRDPTPWGELCALVKAKQGDTKALESIVKRLRQPDCAFLSPPETVELSDSVDIDVTHEALLRRWKRLGGWLKREREFAWIYDDLLKAERSYKRKKGQLLAGKRLREISTWWRKNTPSEAWAMRYHEPEYDESGTEVTPTPEWHAQRFASAQKFLNRSWWRRWEIFGVWALAGGAAAWGLATAGQTKYQTLEKEKAQQARVTAEAGWREADRQRGVAEKAQVSAEQKRKEAEAALQEVKEANAKTEAALQTAKDETSKAQKAKDDAVRANAQTAAQLVVASQKLQDRNTCQLDLIGSKSQLSELLQTRSKCALDLDAARTGASTQAAQLSACTTELSRVNATLKDASSANARLTQSLKLCPQTPPTAN